MSPEETAQMEALRARVIELEARLDLETGNIYDVVVAENEKLREEVKALKEAGTRLFGNLGMLHQYVDIPDDLTKQINGTLENWRIVTGNHKT